MRGFKQKRVWLALLLAPLVLIAPNIVYAACPNGSQSCSNSFQVDQTFFGSGGVLEACSTSFCSKQTAGELAVGETNSSLYRAYAGFNTTDAPYIELAVTGANIDLGVLDSSAASTTNGQFYVRAWQANGYVVRTESDPPTSSTGGHQIAPLTGGGSSSPGSEQFGINLVANSCPSPAVDCTNPFGINPAQIPDGTFSFGYVTPGYDTADTYKYNKGDMIARSDSSTSVTVYTVSYLYNISDITPAGRYTFKHSIVATATY